MSAAGSVLRWPGPSDAGFLSVRGSASDQHSLLTTRWREGPRGGGADRANDSEENRSLNRRVEVVVATQEVAADNTCDGRAATAPALVATGAQGVVSTISAVPPRATYPFDHLMSANDPTSRICVCDPRVGGLDGARRWRWPRSSLCGDVDSIVVQVGDAAECRFVPAHRHPRQLSRER